MFSRSRSQDLCYVGISWAVSYRDKASSFDGSEVKGGHFQIDFREVHVVNPDDVGVKASLRHGQGASIAATNHLSRNGSHGQLISPWTKWPPFWQTTFSNENGRIPIKISLKFVAKSPIDNWPALVQVMAWRRTGDTPLPEPMKNQFTDIYAAQGGDELKWGTGIATSNHLPRKSQIVNP